MLTDIYARSMLNATRHCDVPQKPLPSAYREPRHRSAPLRKLLRHLGTLLDGKIARTLQTRLQRPVNCK